eukprot:15366451-Ditylum_brightwellii.AAC.1
MNLNTEMKQREYMQLPFSLLLWEVIEAYELEKLQHEGYVYMETQKGKYMLPQAGKIVSEQLQQHLSKYDYHTVLHTP